MDFFIGNVNIFQQFKTKPTKFWVENETRVKAWNKANVTEIGSGLIFNITFNIILFVLKLLFEIHLYSSVSHEKIIHFLAQFHRTHVQILCCLRRPSLNWNMGYMEVTILVLLCNCNITQFLAAYFITHFGNKPSKMAHFPHGNIIQIDIKTLVISHAKFSAIHVNCNENTFLFCLRSQCVNILSTRHLPSYMTHFLTSPSVLTYGNLSIDLMWH